MMLILPGHQLLLFEDHANGHRCDGDADRGQREQQDRQERR
jgi:hypothetical protein